MYENITFESILKRMLDKIPNTFDKREGSIIYDALAPAAVELQNAYIEIDAVLNESFADTQTRDFLIKRCKERGIIPYPATNAVLKAISAPSTVDIPIGSRFSLNELNYIITEKITDGEYTIQCETPGEIGNSYFGDLIPIDYIHGLQSITIVELLIPGENDEDTEDIRERYFNSLDSQAFGGNIEDYKEKTKAANNGVGGVGGVKVYPTWQGGGTVKLVIVDSTFSKPSATLVNAVQEKIDPVQNQGAGLGIAPIGHVVTVVGCSETPVEIQTHITFQEDWTWDDVKPYVKKEVDVYFKELSSEWESSENLIVRISQIETRLLNLTGILDIGDTTLNGVAQNLTLDADSIPVQPDGGSVTSV